MRKHIEGERRDVGLLFPRYVEDYVGKENPVRFIEAFVERLDLVKLGFTKAQLADTGRRPYDPKDFLKLHLWGYLNRVVSSRKLERETQRNLEVMWLLRKLTPDDKTISEFRRENTKVIKGVFVEFRLLCQNLKLFGEDVAIDGSKFGASNSKKRNFTQEKLERRIGEIEKQVNEYLSSIERNDAKEVRLPKETALSLQEKISNLDARLKEYRGYLEELKDSKEKQKSLTDEDSRTMHTSQGSQAVSYNAQIAVDSKAQLIVEYEVTNEPTDKEQLLPMAQATKKALGVEALTVSADKGYNNPEHIAKCEENGIQTYVPPMDTAKMHKGEVPTPEYELDKFKYNPQDDTYTCPQGERLYRIGKANKRRYSTKACKECPVRSFCTSCQRGRIVERKEHQEAMDRLAQRVAENPEKTKKRGQVVEPVFGTIKSALSFRAFGLRTLGKVCGEFGFVALAYNIRRVLNIKPIEELIGALSPTSTPIPV